MSTAESQLLSRFYQEMTICLVLLGSISLIAICMVVYLIIRFKNTTMLVRGILLFSISCLICMGLFFAKTSYTYLSDLSFAKTKDYIVTEGKLIRYKIAISSDDLSTSRSWPCFLTSDGEEFTLNILKCDERMVLEKEYILIYLPNTKIAEFVEISE